MTKKYLGWVILGTAALLAPVNVRAQEVQPAQDIGTATPPELRDFRLDTPPPEAAPETAPETAPQAAPQPSAQNPQPASSQPQPAPNQRSAGNLPTAREPVLRTDTPADTLTAPSAPVTVAPADESDRSNSPPDILPEKADNGIDDEAGPLVTDGGIGNSAIWAGAALALLLALVGITLLVRRKQNGTTPAREIQLPPQQPSPPARLDRSKPVTAPPPPKQAPTAAPLPSIPDPVFAEYKPEAAQLSIASLSVTGKLTIINRGQIAIENLLMRSHMMSAQTGQQEAIAAFHNAKESGSSQSLGSLAAGERIDAVIEIRQPRTELSTFRWTEREFVAPIILINLSGKAGDSTVDLQLSHLIGREGSDSSARMKPLPIDRGPKRFTGVSARPIIA